MSRTTRAIGLTLALLPPTVGGAGQAEANVTIRFAGVVDWIDSGTSPVVQPGHRFAGALSLIDVPDKYGNNHYGEITDNINIRTFVSGRPDDVLYAAEMTSFSEDGYSSIYLPEHVVFEGADVDRTDMGGGAYNEVFRAFLIELVQPGAGGGDTALSKVPTLDIDDFATRRFVFQHEDYGRDRDGGSVRNLGVYFDGTIDTWEPVTAIPEPSPLVLGLIGGALAGGYWLRRRAAA